MVTVSTVVMIEIGQNVVYLCFQTMTIVTVSSVVLTDWGECGVFVLPNHDNSHCIQCGDDRLGRMWCICVFKP